MPAMEARGGPCNASFDLWKRLHTQEPAEDKVRVASSLLGGSHRDDRAAVWLFEWLVGPDGCWSKKALLSASALELLCEILDALPATYPLGSQTPLLLAQLRGALTSDASVASAQRSGSCEGGSQVLLQLHVRLVCLLLKRSPLSFRLTPEQASPLFVVAVESLERCVAAAGRDAPDNDEKSVLVSELVAGAARLLERALEFATDKKGFKTLLDVLPAISRLFATTPEDMWPSFEGGVAHAVGEGWANAVAAARNLAHGLFDRRHLKGFEVLARAPESELASYLAEQSQPSRKRARKDKAGEEGTPSHGHSFSVYQVEFFRCVNQLLLTVGGRDGCVRLLPALFTEFVTEYRRLGVYRSVVSDAGNVGESSNAKKRAPAPSEMHELPCEFWFFKQLSRALRAAVDSCPSAETPSIDTPRSSPYVLCLVELWRSVGECNAYRPREDPRRIQAKTLGSFCGFLVERLQTYKNGASARGAPEWEGLIEALKLDAEPFERRLGKVWGTIVSLCPKPIAVEEGASAPACVRLAIDLLGTYARLADLPTCMTAMTQALVERKGAARLLSDSHLIGGMRAAAREISAGSTATQITQIWNALLRKLQPGDSSAGGAWWSAVVLRHTIEGLRATELSLHPLRTLLIRTFQCLEGGTMGSLGVTDEARDGLLLACCCLGRQLGAWELPPCAQPSKGDGATLAQHVWNGLGKLARCLLDTSGRPDASLSIYMQAAVQFLAVFEQERDCSYGVGSDAPSTPLEIEAICSRLLALASDASVEAAEARRAVCSWAPLFSAQVVRRLDGCALRDTVETDQRQSKHDEPAYDASTVTLVNLFVPAESACWRFLSRAWSADAANVRASALLGLHSMQAAKQLDNAKPRLSLPREKVWAPAAELWTMEGEAVLEPAAPLRAPLLRRFAELIEEAAFSIQDKSERESKRQVPVLLGLHKALHRATFTSLRGVAASVVLLAIRAVVATLTVFCALLTGGEAHVEDAESAATGCRAAMLVTVALSCLAQLLDMLSSEASDSAGEAAVDAIKLIVGGRKNKGRKPAAQAVAELLASGKLQGQDACAVTASLAVVARSLFRLRYAVWPEEARRAWAAGLVSTVIDKRLDCKLDEGTVRIHVPNPLTLLACAGQGAGRSSDLDDAGKEGSLSCLLTVLEGSCVARDSSTTPSLGQALTVVLGAAPSSDSLSAMTLSAEDAHRRRTCIGISSAILAKCVELGAIPDQSSSASSCGGLLQIVGCPGEGDVEASSTRSALVQLAVVMVRNLQSHREQLGGEDPSWRKVREGISALAHALSSRWPDGDNDDLWQNSWVPLVVDWAALFDPSAAEAIQTPAEACSEGNFSGLNSAMCCSALCTAVGRDRREHVVLFLTRRVALLVSQGVEDTTVPLSPLLSVAGGLAAVLRGLPQTPPLRPHVAASVTTAARALLGAVSEGKEAPLFRKSVTSHCALMLCVAAIAEGLFVHLAGQHRPKRGLQGAHFKLAEAEALLLHVAGLQVRTALTLQTADAGCNRAHAASAAAGFGSLLSSSYGLMSALFSSVPAEGKKIPSWTQKPHIVVGVLKLMLEAIYAAPSGAQAAVVAADTIRLWEAFTLGGTRLVASSAGRSGQSTFQAKVQRATQSFVIMIIAHTLEQQRQWIGVDAAVQRSLLRFEPRLRAAARAAETASWKETASLVQVGMGPLLGSLEGADHLKQGMYVSLREPLNTMFKEVHESFQQRTKYKGEA